MFGAAADLAVCKSQKELPAVAEDCGFFVGVGFAKGLLEGFGLGFCGCQPDVEVKNSALFIVRLGINVPDYDRARGRTPRSARIASHDRSVGKDGVYEVAICDAGKLRKSLFPSEFLR